MLTLNPGVSLPGGEEVLRVRLGHALPRADEPDQRPPDRERRHHVRAQQAEDLVAVRER